MDYETLIDLTSEKLKMNDRQVENFPPSLLSLSKETFHFCNSPLQGELSSHRSV